MNNPFVKAEKRKSKLRCAIFGPSGAGKTYSALRIATGMGGKIALIDSERGSASLYADKFEFDIVDLPEKKIEAYVYFIGLASEAGYNVLIIDSLSHAWHELLEEVDRLASAKYRGNTWSAWSEGTPRQKKLIDALLSFNGHIIVTMRSKTEWSVEQGNNGKSKPTRVGLSPEQGKGIEYEFSLLVELSTDHIANVIKDRTGKFQDEIITKPDEKFGGRLIDWLNDGKAELPPPPPAIPANGTHPKSGNSQSEPDPEPEQSRQAAPKKPMITGDQVKKLVVESREYYGENWEADLAAGLKRKFGFEHKSELSRDQASMVIDGLVKANTEARNAARDNSEPDQADTISQADINRVAREIQDGLKINPSRVLEALNGNARSEYNKELMDLTASELMDLGEKLKNGDLLPF